MSARSNAEGRYSSPRCPETESEPGSRGRVLRNKLGIVSSRQIDREEFEALVVAQERYFDGPIEADTQITADLLRAMHRDWLGSIYSWAGTYRTVNVAKGSFSWPPAYLVEQNMKACETGVLARHTPCPPGSISSTARHLAIVHAELLLVHPFRDGNGRLARWLADLMAAQAGLSRPEYRFKGKGGPARRQEYLKAVLRGYAGNYDLLTDFFETALSRGAAVARRD